MNIFKIGLVALTSTHLYCTNASTSPQNVSRQQCRQDPNPLDRFGNKKSNNLYVSGEAIWFKPLNKTYFLESSRGVSSSSYVETKKAANEPQFQPAFRLALGYNTNFDGWDLKLTYTRFIYKTSTASARFNEFNMRYNTPPPAQTSGLDTRQGPNIQILNYKYNLLDLDLGRMYKISQRLSAKPFIGLRSLWFKTENGVEDNYQTRPRVNIVTVDSQIIYFSSYLIGMKTGCDGIWRLSKEFSIVGNLTLSTLVNSHKTTLIQDRPTAFSTVDMQPFNWGGFYQDSARKSTTFLTTNLDLSLGLGWDKNFADDKYHLGLNFSYEQHSYWTMNNSEWAQTGGDLSFNLQGIALGARLDF